MGVIITNLKMNFIRAQKNKIGLVIGFLILPIVIFCVLNFFKASKEIGTIAVIGNNTELESYLSEQHLNFKKLEDLPGMREIMLRTYEGTILTNNSGEEQYVNYGGPGTESVLQSIIHRSYQGSDGSESIFPTIILYVFGLMFLQAVLNIRLLIEDRQIGVFIRLQNCFSNRQQYMLSQLFYNIAMLFIPSVLSLLLFGKIQNAIFQETGIEIMLVTLTAAVLCSVMALFLCVLVRNNESTIMVGNIVVVLSTLLSGTFGEISSRGLNFISTFMPQRLFIKWLKPEEPNKYYLYNKEFILIIIFIVCFYFFSSLYFKRSWGNSFRAAFEEDNNE